MYFVMCLSHSYEAECGNWQIRLRASLFYANKPFVIIIIYLHGIEISILTIFTHDTCFHLHCSNVYEAYCDNL